MALKDWLQLTRAHTAPLEAVPAFVGAALGAGTVYSPMVLAWGVFGVLYHLVGYGHNSIEDYNSGHDKNDPHKQHHPMNRNGILFRTLATFAIYAGMFLTAALSIVMVYYSPSDQYLLIIGIIFLCIASGLAYNLMGKETNAKFLPISIAHTSVFVIPFIAMGSAHIEMGAILSAYVFLWVAFQIGFSGELKDIDVDEENLMADLGVRTYRPLADYDNKKVHIPPRVFFGGMVLKAVGMVVGVYAIGYAEGWSGDMVVAFLLSTLTMYATISMLRSGAYERSDLIDKMGAIEMGTFIVFVVAATPVIGKGPQMALVIGSIVWLMAFNKIEWGTYLSPKV